MANKRRRKPGDGLGKIEDGDVMSFPVQFMDHEVWADKPGSDQDFA
jgi:hypothetical protein